MQFTGERLTTRIKGKIAIEHLHRYALTLDWLAGKAVLDIASGTGYGSNLMATVAASVTGVDVDPEAVEYARSQYHRSNLSFLHGSATSIPLAENSVDVVVSFETIEHLTEHQEMITEIRRVLRPDGALIISSPDKKYYSDIPQHRNDFHLRELYRDEFEKLIQENFQYVDFYLQGFVVGSMICTVTPSAGIKQYSGNFDKITEDPVVNYSYNLAVCSNTPLLIKLTNSVFNDEKLFNAIEEFYVEKMDSIYRSKSYRIGNFFVELYRKVFGKPAPM